MLLITVNENPVLQSLSDFVVGSTGIFQYDEDEGYLFALIETNEGFAWEDICCCVRLGAPENGKIEVLKKKEKKS